MILLKVIFIIGATKGQVAASIRRREVTIPAIIEGVIWITDLVPTFYYWSVRHFFIGFGGLRKFWLSSADWLMSYLLERVLLLLLLLQQRILLENFLLALWKLRVLLRRNQKRIWLLLNIVNVYINVTIIEAKKIKLSRTLFLHWI